MNQPLTSTEKREQEATSPNAEPVTAREFFAAIDPSAPPYIPELHDDDCEDVTCARCIAPAPSTTQ